MLFLPTAQILAARVQQRQFDGVRLDGPIEPTIPSGHRGLGAVLSGLAHPFATRRTFAARQAS
jgi:hypothetical protein